MAKREGFNLHKGIIEKEIKCAAKAVLGKRVSPLFSLAGGMGKLGFSTFLVGLKPSRTDLTPPTRANFVLSSP